MVAHTPGPLRLAAVLAPVVLAALAALAHGLLASTGAALLLVLGVVAVLLLAVGLAVTEIAARGKRHQERAAQRAAHLAGIAEAAGLASRSEARGAPGEIVADMIGEVLDLDACRHVADPAPEPESERPVLERDGTVRWAGRAVDVRREGLPATDVIVLPAGHHGEAGSFLLTATSTVRRPDRERLLVAVTLAEQLTLDAPAPWAGSPRRREA